MSGLKDRLVGLIRAGGPISVADYMALCLFDPQAGYYTTREPFGRAGDFTTAPEISQMFGELVGIWVVTAWQAMGKPERLTLAEIGPGRGTLMKDIARTVSRIAPQLWQCASLNLVEVSERLSDVQRQTLGPLAARAQWHRDIATLPDLPLLIVGNELFDAIPIRQFVRGGAAWRERMVTLDDAGRLVFAIGAAGVDPELLPPGADTAPEGAIVELAPARSALMDRIATLVSERGGAGLFIDYGHAASAVGDTLQAVLKHGYDDVLAHPGEADLTSHVDFAALAGEARARGLETALMTQGDFLLRLGLLERAGRLGADRDEASREAIRSQVERLAAPDQMGTLFKALCIARPGAMPAPFGTTG